MGVHSSGRPHPFTVGWLLHSIGIVGLGAVVLSLLLMGKPRIVWRTVDAIAIGAIAGAALLVLGLTSAIGLGLRARRRWAAGLALARAILAILSAGALFVALPLLAILPPVGVFLIGPWLAGFAGEILLCVGGIMAFVRHRRARRLGSATA